jgi:hypothetical protein
MNEDRVTHAISTRHGWECRPKPNGRRPSATSVLRPNVFLRNASARTKPGAGRSVKIEQRNRPRWMKIE